MLSTHHRLTPLVSIIFLLVSQVDALPAGEMSTEPPSVFGRTLGSTTAPQVIVARSTTSEAVHDRLFIPAIISMVVVAFLGIVCCFKLGWCFNKKKKDSEWLNSRGIPPLNHDLNHRTSILAPQFAPAGQHTQGGSDAPTTSSRRQSRVQRKPPPNRPSSMTSTTPSNMGTPVYPHQRVTTLNDVVYQQPHSQTNPEYNPYPYSRPMTAATGTTYAPPQPAMNIQRTGPTSTDTTRGHWGQEGPRKSTLSSGQSSTQVASEQLSYMTPPENRHAPLPAAPIPQSEYRQPPARIPGSWVSPPPGFSGYDYEPAYDDPDQKHGAQWNSGNHVQDGSGEHHQYAAASSSGHPPVYPDSRNQPSRSGEKISYPQQSSHRTAQW
ncbi:hypothetical protein B0H34DRAFT_794305 [Crassisporium funariophilum]|nr:hypothetical protein B0H34DRAFT_794305 [Crassisporium funariophilum]